MIVIIQSSAAAEAEVKAKQAAEREKLKFMMDQKKLLEEQLAKVRYGLFRYKVDNKSYNLRRNNGVGVRV